MQSPTTDIKPCAISAPYKKWVRPLFAARSPVFACFFAHRQPPVFSTSLRLVVARPGRRTGLAPRFSPLFESTQPCPAAVQKSLRDVSDRRVPRQRASCPERGAFRMFQTAPDPTGLVPGDLFLPHAMYVCRLDPAHQAPGAGGQTQSCCTYLRSTARNPASPRRGVS